MYTHALTYMSASHVAYNVRTRPRLRHACAALLLESARKITSTQITIYNTTIVIVIIVITIINANNNNNTPQDPGPEPERPLVLLEDLHVDRRDLAASRNYSNTVCELLPITLGNHIMVVLLLYEYTASYAITLRAWCFPARDRILPHPQKLQQGGVDLLARAGVGAEEGRRKYTIP